MPCKKHSLFDFPSILFCMLLDPQNLRVPGFQPTYWNISSYFPIRKCWLRRMQGCQPWIWRRSNHYYDGDGQCSNLHIHDKQVAFTCWSHIAGHGMSTSIFGWKPCPQNVSNDEKRAFPYWLQNMASNEVQRHIKIWQSNEQCSKGNATLCWVLEVGWWHLNHNCSHKISKSQWGFSMKLHLGIGQEAKETKNRT